MVDDGSTDKTAMYAMSLASKVIRTDNHGPAAARNKGIQYASGDIIALIDSDCEAEMDWAENIYKVFQNKKISIIMGRVKIPPSNYLGESISGLGYPAGGSIGFDKVWKVTSDGYTNTLSTCNCVFRRDIFNRFGPFDVDFPFAGGEDTLFAANIVGGDVRIKYCPAIKVWHEPMVNLQSFLKWQITRGKCAFLFKKKIGRIGGFVNTRLWSTKNVVQNYLYDKRFPLILLLILCSYALQCLGFMTAKYFERKAEKKIFL